MGAYTSEIDFRKKQLVLIGTGKILAAGGGGRFFSAPVGDSVGYGVGDPVTSLEVRGVTMKNGRVGVDEEAARQKGGAIFLDASADISDSTTLIKIYDSTFETNSCGGACSGGYGGAIYTAGENAKLEIKKSKFKNNYAQHGGAISIDSGAHTIVESTFTGNRVVEGVTFEYMCGDPASRDIHLSCSQSRFQATLVVYQSNFLDNELGNFAAVFYCQKGYRLTSDQRTCQACAPGLYSGVGYNKFGTSVCTACPPGRYNVNAGSTDLETGCTYCSPGTYSNITGATKCEKCR
jgi:hypothetical protein